MIRELDQEIDVMQEIAPEWKIKDPKTISYRSLEQRWSDCRSWKVYLPEGEYAIRLATHEIAYLSSIGKQNLPPIVGEAQIHGGLHRIELQFADDMTRYVVLIDGQEFIDVSDKSAHGAVIESNCVKSGMRTPEEPVILYWEQFRTRLGDDECGDVGSAANGVLLWIECATWGRVAPGDCSPRAPTDALCAGFPYPVPQVIHSLRLR
jgi:hypothetical protein